MGVYYEWSDYQAKGLSYEQLCGILSDKGMSIIEEISNEKSWSNIIDHINEIKDWAKENLSGMWATVFRRGNGTILALFFEDEADAMAFKLRWL